MTAPEPRHPRQATRVRVGRDLHLEVTTAGAGEPILLLHGFPTGAWLWERQIDLLVDKGYFVIAPDLRGYGGSDKPAHRDDYKLNKLLNDVLCVLQAFRVQQVTVVGHDFGSYLAWSFTSLLGRRVKKLVAVSVAHPLAFLEPTQEQLRRSWYRFLFQLPEAEEILRRGNFRLLRDAVTNFSGVERCVRDLRRPGALTGALNWYRANGPVQENFVLRPDMFPTITVPVVAVWSDLDHAVAEETMLRSERYVSGGWDYRRVSGGHYVPLDGADELNAILDEVLPSFPPAFAREDVSDGEMVPA